MKKKVYTTGCSLTSRQEDAIVIMPKTCTLRKFIFWWECEASTNNTLAGNSHHVQTLLFHAINSSNLLFFQDSVEPEKKNLNHSLQKT
jgi:hypothetical protein